MSKKRILDTENLSVDERMETAARLFKNLPIVQQRQLLIQIIQSLVLDNAYLNPEWKEINTTASKDPFKTAYVTFVKAMTLIYGSDSRLSVGFDYFGGEMFFVRRSPDEPVVTPDDVISDEFMGDEELAKEMLPMLREKFEFEFSSMIHKALIAASYEVLSPIYTATKKKFVKEYAAERWHRGESGESVKYIERIKQTIEDGIFTTKRVKQFKPGRLPLSEEQKKARDEEKRVKFIAALNKAAQKWYAQGHRKRPRQSDLSVIMYPPSKYRRESAQSMLSTNLKKAGLKFADLDLNRKSK